MAKQELNTIRNWFKTGFKPSQLQFWDVWDSFWHKDDQIAANNIAGLGELLDGKADSEAFGSHLNDVDAHGISSLRQTVSELDQVVEEIQQAISTPIEIILTGEAVNVDGNIDLSEDLPGEIKRAPSVFIDDVTGAYAIQFNKQTKIISGLYGLAPEAKIEIYF